MFSRQARPRHLRTLQRMQVCQACASPAPAWARHTAAQLLSTGFGTSILTPTSILTTTTTTTTTTPTRAFSASARRLDAAPLLDAERIAALVATTRDDFLAKDGVPTESETTAALAVLAEAAALVMETAPHAAAPPQPPASGSATLLQLDGLDGLDGQLTASGPRTLAAVVSEAAFSVVDDARVVLSTAILAQYVAVQARLGRPETLPRILEAYARRDARTSSANYKRARYAVPPAVADAALDAALAAKDLDAAVGVVEWTYAAPAFLRLKMLKRGLVPAFALVSLPTATYTLSEMLAAHQSTMDARAATGLSFAAILAYVGFTGSIGVIATATANDQMNRVTWAPGTALRERWLREDERAALDRVALAFGFRESYRYGEEQGPEFQALREYIMSKGMLLDQIELMEGMGS